MPEDDMNEDEFGEHLDDDSGDDNVDGSAVNSQQ